ncbi:hypothetical protein Tco_0700537 [Tanacetum coccineum]
MRLASSLRFVSRHLAFCLNTSLRFASRHHCVLSKDITAFCFKTSLHFASRHLAFCLKTSLRIASRHHYVLLQDILRFVKTYLRFCLKKTAFCLSQMHNNIMAAGLRDRPPMLATGRYAQWRSWFLRYIDIRPNGDALQKCILKGPYTPTIVTTPAVPAKAIRSLCNRS